ncbi:hypothetical protein AAZV13_16G110750 [Glycine max]
MVKTRDTAASMTNVIEEQGNMALSNAQEERILVSIRIRPLNKREKARHDTRTTAMWNHDHSQWIPMPLVRNKYQNARLFVFSLTYFYGFFIYLYHNSCFIGNI